VIFFLFEGTEALHVLFKGATSFVKEAVSSVEGAVTSLRVPRLASAV
jgi:hypothetical protein